MSAIPAAIDALAAMASLALPPDGDGNTVQVRAGATPAFPDPQMVGLGSAQGTFRYGYGGRRTENASLVCELTAWSGDPDGTADLRALANEMFEGLAYRIASDRTLADAVDRAEIASQAYMPMLAEQKAGVLLTVTVRIVATSFEGA